MTLWVLCEHGEKGYHDYLARSVAEGWGHCSGGRSATPVDLIGALGGDVIVIEPDADGEWPTWAHEAAAHRLEFIGGTDQWQKSSYRMAYLSVVFRALAAAYKKRILTPALDQEAPR